MIVRIMALAPVLLLAGCCGFLGLAECEKEKDNGEQAAQGKVGCYAASYDAGSGYGVRVGTSLGDPFYDQKMNEEVAIQRFFFNGIPATVWILDEGSPQHRNAYASPDGHILFGYHMFFYVVQAYNELAVAGILAHEWGHRTQYVHGWNTGNPLMELEADAFSGYYMALAKQWAWSQIQGYYANVYATGDYNFHHPQHHGTPQQRLAAAYLGVNAAIDAIQNNRPYSYQELHALFTQQLSSRVADVVADDVVARDDVGPRDVPGALPSPEAERLSRRMEAVDLEAIAEGRGTGEEVTYPRRLSIEQVLELRPYDDAERASPIS